MRRIMSLCIVLSFLGVALAAFAESPAGNGPEVIKFKMGDLVLPFKHWGHQNSLENKCSPCHVNETPKIANWSKETAHTLCVSCHEGMKKGPVECKQCHTIHYSRK